MQLEFSFAEVASFGAIIAVLVVLLIGGLVVLLGGRWMTAWAARFKKFGVERTDDGHVQFSGFVHGRTETRVSVERASYEKWMEAEELDRAKQEADEAN